MAFYLWLLVYLFFTILSLVLLLNLLIAMLSFTFETVRSESTLQCRTTFAQCLMRLELQATSLRMAVNVGEKKMQGSETRYTYDFRSISSKPVDDLGAECVEGSDNPFAIPDGGPIGRSACGRQARSRLPCCVKRACGPAQGRCRYKNRSHNR